MECPRCGCPCAVRYREVPPGQRAQFVCGKCIGKLGLPSGGYTGKTIADFARRLARDLNEPAAKRACPRAGTAGVPRRRSS
jgi:hypothetical protein